MKHLYKKSMRRICAVSLVITSLSMMLSGCALKSQGTVSCTREQADEGAAKWYDTASEYHADMDYSEMEVQDIDEDAVDELLAQVREDIDDNAPGSTLIDDYDKLLDTYDMIDTQLILTEIKYNSDATNTEYEELDSELTEYVTDISDRMFVLIRDELKSDNGDELSDYIDDDDLIDEFLDYEEMTDREKEIDKQITDLQHEYDSIMQKDYTVTVDGQDWLYSDLTDSYNNDEIWGTDYWDGYEQYMKQVNADAVEVYLQMVPLLNEEARIEGYDNFAEYGYDAYNRDFTTDEIKSVYKGVKDYIVPLYVDVENMVYYNDDLGGMNLTEEERIDKVAPIIGEIDPGLMQAWYYLTDHHLYDLESVDTKNDTGYTIALPEYGSAFIFDSPYCSYEDIYTVIHEFGHYNAFFHNQAHSLISSISLDVDEIHSQEMELLSFEYADELFGEKNADQAILYKLYTLLDTVIDGCVYDEFQNEIFSYDGELTAYDVNHMFKEINESYIGIYDEGVEEDYEWVNVPHTFSAPMYYLSYATSGLAAFDIFSIALEDRQAGIDCYMDLTSYGDSLGYRELMKETGLPDIFEEDTIMNIADEVHAYADEQEESYVKTSVVYPLAAYIVISLIIVTLVIVLCKRYSRKRSSNLPRE